MRLDHDYSVELVELMRLERLAFAAKLRLGRAVLGWSQSELAARAGLTQRAIHKLEKGDTEPHRSTVLSIEQIWRGEGLEFEEMSEGFRVVVRPAVLDRERPRPPRIRHS